MLRKAETLLLMNKKLCSEIPVIEDCSPNPGWVTILKVLRMFD